MKIDIAETHYFTPLILWKIDSQTSEDWHSHHSMLYAIQILLLIIWHVAKEHIMLFHYDNYAWYILRTTGFRISTFPDLCFTKQFEWIIKVKVYLF